MTDIRNDENAIRKDFLRAIGNGHNATRHLYHLTALAVSSGSGNTGPLARVYDASIMKGDKNAANAIATVVRLVWPGAKKTTDKNENTTFKTSGCTVDTGVMTRFKDMVEAPTPVSIRGTAFKKTLEGNVGKPDIPVAEFAQKRVTNTVKALFDKGMTPAAIVAMVQEATRVQGES